MRLIGAKQKSTQKVISEEHKDTVRRFFESDEVSPTCPGQKDCVKVISAEGAMMQKRPVLGNLREMFELYKTNEKNHKIRFSTFAQLRPSYCVLAGSLFVRCFYVA